MAEPIGWYATYEKNETGPGGADVGWTMVLDTGNGIVVSTNGPWFMSQADCEEFIRDYVLPAGGQMLVGEPSRWTHDR